MFHSSKLASKVAIFERAGLSETMVFKSTSTFLPLDMRQEAMSMSVDGSLKLLDRCDTK